MLGSQFMNALTIQTTDTRVKIGTNNGIGQGNYGIAIGYLTGATGQLDGSVAIGQFAGQTSQKQNSVAIGPYAGVTSQQPNSVAVGGGAGNNTQGTYSVAVGPETGAITQGEFSVAFGYAAGYTSQNANAIAIGREAGYTGQGSYSLAIGHNTARNSQGGQAIAIGYLAGFNSQGGNSIAIGTLAAPDSQSTNTIVLNATGATLNPTSSSSVYIAPIRNDQTGINARLSMYYNTTTKEITTGPTASALINSNYNFSNLSVANTLSTSSTFVNYISAGIGHFSNINMGSTNGYLKIFPFNSRDIYIQAGSNDSFRSGTALHFTNINHDYKTMTINTSTYRVGIGISTPQCICTCKTCQYSP